MKKSMLNVLFVLTLLALVTENASAAFRIPDGGTTSVLLVGALGGLTMLRRFIR